MADDAKDAILTLEELLERTETRVTLPLLSQEIGGRVIRARRVARGEYLSLLPPLPPEAAQWPPEELAARELAWIRTLPPEDLERRRAELRDVLFRVVALAALEPVLTLEHARRLGDDAAAAAVEILRFSGIVPGLGAAAPAEAPAAAVDQATEATAPTEPTASAAG